MGVRVPNSRKGFMTHDQRLASLPSPVVPQLQEEQEFSRATEPSTASEPTGSTRSPQPDGAERDRADALERECAVLVDALTVVEEWLQEFWMPNNTGPMELDVLELVEKSLRPHKKGQL